MALEKPFRPQPTPSTKSFHLKEKVLFVWGPSTTILNEQDE
jgi:hypothetical protein